MQNIVARLVEQLMAKGMSRAAAQSIAMTQMRKHGNINASGELTAKGKERSNMTPAERAKDRAAKESGGTTSDYKYNPYNNTAVKGRVNSKVKRRK